MNKAILIYKINKSRNKYLSNLISIFWSVRPTFSNLIYYLIEVCRTGYIYLRCAHLASSLFNTSCSRHVIEGPNLGTEGRGFGYFTFNKNIWGTTQQVWHVICGSTFHNHEMLGKVLEYYVLDKLWENWDSFRRASKSTWKANPPK